MHFVPWLKINRYSYLQALYKGLSETSKSKIRTREGIESYTEHEHGVTIRTDNDNVIEGSVLVGADGVHSWVRQLMARHIKEVNPRASQILANGFKTRDGIVTNTYYPEHLVGILSVAGIKGKIFWSIYIPNEKETKYPSPRYSQADVDYVMKKWGHLQVTPDYTLNDLYESLIRANLLPMEEGAIGTKWNYGRTVMIGDAVHKATANLGMGGNLCVDDVCRLGNGLYALLERTKNPTTAELTKVFDAYEKAQRPRADFVRRASGIFAGYETMSKWYSRLMRLVFPYIPSMIKMRVFSDFDRSAPMLNFLPVPGS